MLYTFDVVALHVPAVCHGANDVGGAVHVTLLSTQVIMMMMVTGLRTSSYAINAMNNTIVTGYDDHSATEWQEMRNA